MLEVRLCDYSRGKYFNLLRARGFCRGKIYEHTTPPQQDIDAVTTNIVDHRHLSLLEFFWVMFEVVGVSRECIDQLRTHRLFSFTVESMRSVEPKGMIVPSKYDKRVQTRFLSAYYRSMVDYKWLMEHGAAREDARRVVPIGAESSVCIAGNGRTFFEYLPKRLCKEAEWESRELASQIKSILSMLLPSIFSKVKCLGCSKNCGKGDKNG